MKKMKKRRELDALVNGNKMGRRKKGQHELLRNESDSSEVEEFSIPEKSVIRKGNSCRFCATCLTVCGAFLLVACIAAVGGLVWFHLELKKEVDQLRLQIAQVQNTPYEGLQQLADKHEALEAKVKILQDRDVSNLQKNISILYNQISAINATVNKLSKASKKQDIPGPNIQSKELIENVANFGSRIQTLEGEYEQLKTSVDEISPKIPLISELVEDVDSVNASVTTHFHQVAMTLKQFKNKTDSLDLRLSLVDTKPDSPSLPNIDLLVQDAIHKSLEDVENLTQAETRTNKAAIEKLQEACDAFNRSLQALLAQNMVTQPMVTEAADQTKDIPQGALVLALQQGLQGLANQTHTSIKTLNDSVGNLTTRVSNLEMAITSKSSAAQIPTTSPPNGEKTNMELKEPDQDTGNKDTEGSQNGDQPLLTTNEVNPTTTAQDEGFDIDGVNNWDDLQKQFPEWDGDSDGKVTYKELVDSFDDLPPREYVMSYDDDNDSKLTPEELARAVLKDFGDDTETDGDSVGDTQQKRSVNLF